MQVKLYSVLIIHESIYVCLFFKLHLRNDMMNWSLTDFKKNNCMTVKDMFLLQVQALSRRLSKENGTGGLEKRWLHFKLQDMQVG